jgi:hypothetical protein
MANIGGKVLRLLRSDVSSLFHPRPKVREIGKVSPAEATDLQQSVQPTQSDKGRAKVRVIPKIENKEVKDT